MKHSGIISGVPGCKCEHMFNATWSFNGDFDKPTVSPSIFTDYAGEMEGKRRCHSFISNGNIQFLNDCWHELKNKTVPLVDF